MTETSALDIRTRPGTLATPFADLEDTVRRKILDDAGTVTVTRADGTRQTVSRIELLYEDVTTQTASVALKWLTSTRRGSVNTKRAYLDDIRTDWAPYARSLGLPAFALGCFTPDHVTAWRIAQEAQGCSARTIARRLNTLSSFHKYAAGRMPHLTNPVTEDDRPVIDKGNTVTSTPVLDKAEIQMLCAVAATDTECLVVQLLYTLAGRITELCSADVSKVTRKNGRTYIDVTRKKNKARVLPLPDSVADALWDHIGDRSEEPLLVKGDGTPLTRHDATRILATLGRRARILTCKDAYKGRGGARKKGEPAAGKRHSFATCEACRKVTPHVMRASRITHMLDDGVPLVEVQAFADHENPATTVGYRERKQKDERNAALVDGAVSLFAAIPRPSRRG